MLGKQRNFGLDVVRAFSILLVVASHRFNYELETGVLGVQIFFVLSGFLIGQILINDFKNGGNLSTVMKFWKRRWYRTLPMYYLVLILKIIIFGNPYGWKMIVYFVFLQANMLGIDFFPVSWSLVVEEWFYIFLPLAVFIFFRKGIRSERFIYFLLSFITFFLFSRLLWNYFHKGVILYQFDCLLLGVMLAAFKIYFAKFYQRLNSVWLFLIGLSGIGVLIMQYSQLPSVPVFSVYYRVIWYFLTSIFVTLIIPFTEQSVFINREVKKVKILYHFFTWTSILTYSIYLIHGDLFRLHFDLPEYLNIIIHFSLLYAIAFIFYTFYEHPMMSLRDKFSLEQYLNSARESLTSLFMKRTESSPDAAKL